MGRERTAGDRDEPIATTVRTLDGILNGCGLAHTFEIYQGDHVNRIAARVENTVLPFFAANLNFDAARGVSRR